MSRPFNVGKWHLRTYLIALVSVTLIATLGTAAFAVRQAAVSYRQASTDRLADTARTLAHAVESDLTNKATLLRTLAAVSAAEGANTSAAQGWLDKVEPDLGRMVVAQSPSPAAPGPARAELLPAGIPRELVDRAARTLAPALSNLYQPNANAPMRVALAVVQSSASGAASRILSLVLPPEQLVRLAPQGGSTRASLLVAITDGTGRIVARSRDSQRFVGKPVPDWAKLQALGTSQGLFEARTTEGSQVIFAFQKLADTPGWVVVVGEPLQAFNARWQQPLQSLLTGGGIALVIALLLTALLARQILRPVQALARNAQAVAASDSEDTEIAPLITTSPLPILEFEQMRESIEAAQAALHRRAHAERQIAQALASSELRYRTLAQAGTLVLWRGVPGGALITATGWQALTGEPEEQALGMGWIRRVHADDEPLIRLSLAEAERGAQQVDVEFRIAAVGDTWRWVRCRGATVVDANRQVTEWVGVLEDVDERRRAQARIVHMAHHDALTGLPNRAEFRRCLDVAVQRAGRGEMAAVMYIDLDRFKEVNDTLGHPVGDALLRAVSQRLKDLVRETDTVARLGGDEFAIVQSKLSAPSDAGRLASRIVETLGLAYQLAGHEASIGASVGVMLITGQDTDAERLLKSADMALYRAKQEGRGRHCFFEPEMDVRMQARRKAELQLREAAARDEFVLSYQPLVNVRFRTFSGAQAALHWNHPEQGRIPFEEFASLAEEMGLLGTLGDWTLGQACMDAAGWPSSAKVAVGISPAQLLREGLGGVVEAALRHSGLSPERLELEVGERALLEDPQRALQALHDLRSLGVRLVMDKFGSGHSALGCLRSFPFDKVRIDRSFVHGIGLQREGDAIVRALASLCDKLGIMTAAEGVDNEMQFDILSAEECTEVQGGLFGGLMPSSEIPAFCEAMSKAADTAPQASGGSSQPVSG